MNSSFGSKNRTKCTYNNDESLTEGNRLVTIISTTLKPVHKDHSRINLVSRGQTVISPPYSRTMAPNKGGNIMVWLRETKINQEWSL